MRYIKTYENLNGIRLKNYFLLISAIQSNLGDMKRALRNGANINTTDDLIYNDGKTPLIISLCKPVFVEMANYLIDAGADINIVDKKGNSALIYSIANCVDDITKKLIDHHAEINNICSFGYTPIIEAAIMSSLNIVKILIDAGAEWNHKTNDGKDFLFYLTKNEVEKIKTEYPDKYENYLILKRGEEIYNI